MGNEARRELTAMEYVILGLLSTGPQTGYSIIQTLEVVGKGWSASSGSIYPALRRLENRGIIRGELEKLRETRPRRIYSITAQGEALLDAWIKSPLSTDEMLNQREIPLIKFLFAEERLSREDILHWLDTYESSMDSYDAMHHYWHNAQLNVSSLHQQLLLEATQMELDMQRNWIQRARERLASSTEELPLAAHSPALQLVSH